MDSNITKDSSQEGTIVNPGKDEGRDTPVGDEGDNANDLRFDGSTVAPSFRVAEMTISGN